MESLELSYLAGYLFGDGSRSKEGRLTWVAPEGEEESINKVKNSLLSLGFSEREKISGVKSYLQEGQFHLYLKDLQEDTKVTQTKRIWVLDAYFERLESKFSSFEFKGHWRSSGLPKFIWSQGELQIGQFLNAVFIVTGKQIGRAHV